MKSVFACVWNVDLHSSLQSDNKMLLIHVEIYTLESEL